MTYGEAKRLLRGQSVKTTGHEMNELAIKMVKHSMVKHGTTQAQEAERIGVSVKAINRALNNHSVTCVNDITLFLKAYPKLDYSDIVGNPR